MIKRLISICIIVILIFNIYGCAQTAEDAPVVGTEIVESDCIEAENEEEIDTENTESESKRTDVSTVVGIKDITWEQVEDNIVVLYFYFWDGSVFDGEIVAYSVQDIVFEDITGNGIDEALIYCDFANNICDWQLVYFFQFDQGSVIDISPSSKDIPELENADWGLWNMWIANETMGDYSSPVYKLESYYKEQGILYVEETLYIGFRDGKWELVQEF